MNILKNKEAKKKMKTTTKVAIAVAVIAAVVFPGVAALAANTGSVTTQTNAHLEKSDKTKLGIQKTDKQKKQEDLKTCEVANRSAGTAFLKANKDALAAKREALLKAQKDFIAAMKAANGDKAAKEAAQAAHKAAVKAAQDVFNSSKKIALDTKGKTSKKCVTISTPATTNTPTAQ